MCLGVSKYATGTIWLCNLSNDNDNYEHGFCGTRPVLIISDGQINDIERACTVLPLSSADKYENYVDTYQIVKIETDRNSYIQCNSPIKVSINKLIKYLFTVSPEILNNVRIKFVTYMNLQLNNFTTTTAISTTNKTITNNSTKDKVSKKLIKKNLIELASNNKVNDYNENKSYDTPTQVEPIKSINRDVNARKRGKNKLPKYKSKFPIGYWTKLSNNIECWNDRLTHSVDYCVKKYDRKDRISWSKHIYNVHKFLLNNGYTEEQLTKPIEMKK